MPLQSWTRVVAAAAFSLAALGSILPAHAGEKAPAVDPRAGRILKAALENLSSAKSFSFTAEVSKEVPSDSGQKIQYIGTLRTAVRRPDRLATLYKGEDRTTNMYYDGKLFTLSNPLDNAYGSWEAPATIDALFDKMKDRLGFVPPLAVLVREGAGSGEMKNILAGSYVGRTSFRGVDYHHLAFVSPKVDWQIWIADGEPVIKRIVITYKKVASAPQYTATFTDWDFEARLSDYQFTFDPPPGASRIEFQAAEK